MKVVLTKAAQSELTEARDWYDRRVPEIAERFLDEFDAIIARLMENPHQFPVVRNDVRRAGFRRFPYGLLFCIKEPRVEVFACFHASRDPRRWQH